MPMGRKLRGIVSVLLSLLLLSIIHGVSNAQEPALMFEAAVSTLSEAVVAEPRIGWGTAELIETDDARLDFDPQVAVDPQGVAVAVWHQWEGPGYDLWSNRFVPGVGWGTSELLETDENILRGAQIAIDPQGNAVVVWMQDDGTRFNIWANRFVPGVGWGTAELIETDDAGFASDPQIVMDPAGNAIAAWEQRDDTRRFNIWANRFVPGGGWGTAVLIETDDAGTADRPQVAVDPQGPAIAVGRQSDGTRDNLWANRFVPGVGWGTAELLETDENILRGAQIAIDPQGYVVAVWSQGDGTRDNIWANRFAGDSVPPDLVISPLVTVIGIGTGVAAVAAVAALLIFKSRGKRKSER